MTEPTSHHLPADDAKKSRTYDLFVNVDDIREEARSVYGALAVLWFIEQNDGAVTLLEERLLSAFRQGVTAGLELWERHGGSGMPDRIDVWENNGDSAAE